MWELEKETEKPASLCRYFGLEEEEVLYLFKGEKECGKQWQMREEEKEREVKKNVGTNQRTLPS